MNREEKKMMKINLIRDTIKEGHRTVDQIADQLFGEMCKLAVSKYLNESGYFTRIREGHTYVYSIKTDEEMQALKTEEVDSSKDLTTSNTDIHVKTYNGPVSSDEEMFHNLWSHLEQRNKEMTIEENFNEFHDNFFKYGLDKLYPDYEGEDRIFRELKDGVLATEKVLASQTETHLSRSSF
jgi:hypothetical protein